MSKKKPREVTLVSLKKRRNVQEEMTVQKMNPMRRTTRMEMRASRALK